MQKKKWYSNPMFLMGCFAVVNLTMYFTLKKFWIGGSSFLPMIGEYGPNNKFLFAFIVNMGVIVGAFIGAFSSKEFCLRMPKKNQLLKAVIGGFLIGIGITLTPGTCTTAFVIGMPMLSVSSFISAAGILVGAYLMFRFVWRKQK